MPTSDFTALLSGTRHVADLPRGTGAVISISFSGGSELPDRRGVAYPVSSVDAMDGATRAVVRHALAEFSGVTGLTFVEVPRDAQLQFFTVTGSDYGGWAYYPNATRSQDVIIDTQNLVVAGGIETILHEIGHAVGLKHPFQGSPRLTPGLDNTAHTIMSYTDRPGVQHLGPLDKAALRDLYGDASGMHARWVEANDAVAVVGTAGDDVAGLVLRTAKAVVRALGGDDRLRLGLADDTVYGGGGNDALAGGAGADVLFGGAGDDTIATGEGPSRIGAGRADGGAGDDELVGGRGADMLLGGTGADRLFGGLGSDSLVGGSGSNTLLGGGADDTLVGAADADVIVAGDGNDRVIGGAGSDRLVAGSGADQLFGGEGNDLLEVRDPDEFRAWYSSALLSGGDGADTLRASDNDVLDGGRGADLLVLASVQSGTTVVFGRGDGRDTVLNFESAVDTVQVTDVDLSSQELRDRLRVVGDDVVLYLGSGDSVRFVGMFPIEINHMMFV